MYEKDEDDYNDYNGNVGFQFRMAKDVFKSPLVMPATQTVKRENTHVDSMQYNATNRLVAEGAKQFAGHEDVIKKLLG